MSENSISSANTEESGCLGRTLVELKGYLLWMLLTTYTSSGGGACRVDMDCLASKSCFIKAYSEQGQCASTLPPVDTVDQSRRALPLPLADRKPGDACELSVDCLPGYACYFARSYSAVGSCLPEDRNPGS